MTFREAEPVAILDKSGHLKGQTKGLLSSLHRTLSFLQRIKLQGCNAGQRDCNEVLNRRGHLISAHKESRLNTE